MLGDVHSCPLMKVCGNCQKSFPKTNEYFHNRVINEFSVRENCFKTYYSLKNVCKQCHSYLTKLRFQTKRSKELNCDLSDFRQATFKKLSNDKTKILEAKNIKGYALLLKRIKKGYVFTTIEQYENDKELWKIQTNISKRKLSYPECSRISELPKEVINLVKQEYVNRVLPDGVIANRLRLKLSECPNQLIENQRLIIQINQILKKDRKSVV